MAEENINIFDEEGNLVSTEVVNVPDPTFWEKYTPQVVWDAQFKKDAGDSTDYDALLAEWQAEQDGG